MNGPALEVPGQASSTPPEGRPSASQVPASQARAIAFAVVAVPAAGTLAALALAWRDGVSTAALAAFAAMYVATLAGVEAGFHRMLSHAAFTGPRWIRACFVVAGSMAAQGPPLFWAATHRRHHAFSDRPGDPHSPRLHGDDVRGILRGWWHAHVGWLFAPHQADWSRTVPDLLKDAHLFRLHRAYPAWLLLGLLLPAAAAGLATGSREGAFEGFLWGGLVRVFVVHHAVWSVNSLCHRLGARPFASGGHATNNFWLSLPSLGGSWHNTHHAFPYTADNRQAWWQFDFCGALVGLLERAGLARDVKRIRLGAGAAGGRAGDQRIAEGRNE